MLYERQYQRQKHPLASLLCQNRRFFKEGVSLTRLLKHDCGLWEKNELTKGHIQEKHLFKCLTS